MTDNVAPLFGGPRHVREVNEIAVAALEEALEAARSGEVVGVVIARLHHDNLSSYQIAGKIGGYGIIGALEVVKAELTHLHIEED
jgi:hypothetical protein